MTRPSPHESRTQFFEVPFPLLRILVSRKQAAFDASVTLARAYAQQPVDVKALAGLCGTVRATRDYRSAGAPHAH